MRTLLILALLLAPSSLFAASIIPVSGEWSTVGWIVIDGPGLHGEVEGSNISDLSCHTCAPGSHFSSFFEAPGVLGTVTYQGLTYQTGPGAGHALFALYGDVDLDLPPIADSATVTAPFTLGGVLWLPNGQQFSLTGLGSVSMDWQRVTDPYGGSDVWAPLFPTYFALGNQPVTFSLASIETVETPESATWLLLTSGWLGLWWHRHNQGNATARTPRTE